jgi:hypothetical protein
MFLLRSRFFRYYHGLRITKAEYDGRLIRWSRGKISYFCLLSELPFWVAWIFPAYSLKSGVRTQGNYQHSMYNQTQLTHSESLMFIAPKIMPAITSQFYSLGTVCYSWTDTSVPLNRNRGDEKKHWLSVLWDLSMRIEVLSGGLSALYRQIPR